MITILLLSLLYFSYGFKFSFILFSDEYEYKAVDELDLNKYIGKWYQVYQDKFNGLFQDIGKCSTATYQLTEDIEWLKILEDGYKINSVLSEGHEKGVDTQEDFDYLKNKYESI